MAAEARLTESSTALLLGPSISESQVIGNGSGTKRKYFQGWRMGLTLGAIGAATILLLNIILTIVWSTRKPVHGGLATIQQGSCSESGRLTLWLHLLINALGTILLAASNYCMQCLSSPTRKDIDKAHAQHRWLDIGVPSLRNLGSISRYRLCLWWLLALSSIPLHLLYNSAVISTQASQEYDVFVGSPALLAGDGVNWSMPVGTFRNLTGDSAQPAEKLYLDQFRNLSTWHNLENAKCIQRYAKVYIVGYGDVIAMTSNLSATVPLLLASQVSKFDTQASEAQQWICSASCHWSQIEVLPWEWYLTDQMIYSIDDYYAQQYKVDYCLSRPVPEQCKIQLSLVIIAVVIICNAIKLCCMLVTLWKKQSTPLVTIGDAIESFMLERDPTTRNMCWANKKTFTSQHWEPSARPWLRQRHFWFASASVRRWIVCNFCSITTIIVAGILLSMGLKELYYNGEHNPGLSDGSIFWNSGFGTANSDMITAGSFGGTSGILLTALIANIPQLLLSFHNGIYTCMLLTDEWSGYAHERKALRVTQPRGSQRSTYRLQLPYKYIIPLCIISTVLHWLVSQSLFLVQVTLYTRHGTEDPHHSISRIGYSCIPLLVVIILGSVTVLVGILNGFRRYKPGIPLAGSCSAAISAACHLPEE